MALIFLVHLFFFFYTPVFSQFHLNVANCADGRGNYKPNSTYQNNLHTLLGTLETSYTPFILGFDHDELFDLDNTVYMLYNCRGDLTAQECHNCVRDAAKIIVMRCPTQKEAIVWYQECMLRYANRNIDYLKEEGTPYCVYNYANVSGDPRQFGEVLVGTMHNLIQQAAYNKSTIGYAAGEGNFTTQDKVYCYAQCTPDILGGLCERCLLASLRSMAGVCGTNRLSIDVMSPSCRLRYDTSPFIGTGLAPMPRPATNSTLPSPPMKGESTARVLMGSCNLLILGFVMAVNMFVIVST